jgi:hypothetical protein
MAAMTAMSARCDLQPRLRVARAFAARATLVTRPARAVRPPLAVIAALAALATLAALSGAAPRPALAQDVGKPPDEGRRMALRAYYLFDSFSQAESALGVDTFTTVKYRGRPGGGLDLEYLVTPFVGLDLAASQTRIEADEVIRPAIGPAFATKGKIDLRPFTLGLYGHFYRHEHADVYIGPFVGVVQMSGGSFRPNDTEFAFGAVLGLDLPLGSSGLALSGVGRVLNNRFPDQLRHVSHLHNNYLFGGGLAYRW